MILRTILSAVAIVLGALLIATWGVSQVAVKSVEDGSAVTNITAAVLDSPTALAAMSVELGDVAIDALGNTAIDVEALGLDGAIRDQVTALVESEAFAAEVERQVGQSHGQFADALTDDARESAPLVLMMDASPLVNDRISEIPLVGSFVPTLTLAPVPVEVASAATIDDARTAYGFMEFAATWFLWIGIALIVVGLVISARRRWFLSKTLLAVGVISLGVWALLTFTAPETIAGWFSSGGEESAANIVIRTFAAESAPSVASRMLWWALIALVGSGIFAFIAAGNKRKTA
ncbi:hypothetical protein [Demequina aurantiaca]|uniref:hypothetical protein n=1 Tax=Demequina aurantiaca TaxID=676200 RepID=UPI003D331668